MQDKSVINVVMNVSDSQDYVEIRIKTPPDVKLTPQLIIDILSDYLVLDPEDYFMINPDDLQ